MESKSIRHWVVIVFVFILVAIALFVPVLLFLASAIPHDSSDLPSLPLFYSTIFASVILSALIATAVHCRMRGQSLLPTGSAGRFVVVLMGSVAGAFVAVLSLAPFVAGENLRSAAAVAGYIGSIVFCATVFGLVGARMSRRWVSRD